VPPALVVPIVPVVPVVPELLDDELLLLELELLELLVPVVPELLDDDELELLLLLLDDDDELELDEELELDDVPVAAFAVQRWVDPSQSSPLGQSLLPVQGPHKPAEQPRPLVQLAGDAHGVPVSHWPERQTSPLWHWLLSVHGPHWPGFPGWQTGACVPWQSRLLLQPATHTCA